GEKLDMPLLEELLLQVGTLSSIYRKPPSTFIPFAKKRVLGASPALTRLAIAAPPVSRLPRTITSAMSQPASSKQTSSQALDMLPASATPRSSNTQLTSSAVDVSSGAVAGLSNPYINDYTPGPMTGNDAVLIDLMTMEDDEDGGSGGGSTAINSAGMVGFNASFGLSGLNLASLDAVSSGGATSRLSSMYNSQQVLNSAFDAAGLDALSSMSTSVTLPNRSGGDQSPMPDLMRQFTSSFDLSGGGSSSGAMSAGLLLANGSSSQATDSLQQRQQLQSAAAFSLSAPAGVSSHLGTSAFPTALSPTTTFFGANSASPFNNSVPFSSHSQGHPNSNLPPNSAPATIRNIAPEPISPTATSSLANNNVSNSIGNNSREVDELAAKMYNTGMLNSFNAGSNNNNSGGAAPYVPTQQVLLDATQSQGLEILGTFARRNGGLQMEMSFVNKSGMAIGDFAIQFNKNTYGITPSGSLNAGTVMPMSSVEVNLPLVTGGPTMMMQPLTNIQIAVKCTAGVFYFQTQYSLHILLDERGQSDQGMFLRMWKDMPDTMQSSHTAHNLRFASMEDMRNKLNMNSVFTVAQRSVGNATHFYTSSKLCDGSMFYSEIKVANNFQAAVIVTKSINIRLIGLYQKAIEDICTA
ncbi:AP-1 complex subunit beta, partial [Coemansia aciculifera]